MLISNDKSGRKKQKYYFSKIKRRRHSFPGLFRMLPAVVGGAVSLAAITLFAMAADFFPFRTMTEAGTVEDPLAMEMAAPPESTPSSWSMIALNSEIYLTTQTPSGIILYTLDGSDPTYEVAEGENGFSLILYGTTKQYGAETPYINVADTGALLGETIVLKAKTIQIDLTTGVKSYEDSTIAEYSYIIIEEVLEAAAAPEGMPPSGSVIEADSYIYLTTQTISGTILYTLDGSTPSYEIVEGPDGCSLVLHGTTKRYGETASYINVSETGALPGQTITVQAKTIQVDLTTGMKLLEDSTVAAFSYTIAEPEPEVLQPAAAPESTPPSGSVIEADSQIYLTTQTISGTILYTLDGSTPSYEIVEGPDGCSLVLHGTTKRYGETASYINVSETGALPGQTITVQAKTIQVDLTTGMKLLEDSTVAAFSYTIAEPEPEVLQPAAVPQSTPPSGSVIAADSKIYLTTQTTSGIILYTLDGSTPSYEIAEGPDGYSLALHGATKRYGVTASHIEAAEAGKSAGQTIVLQAKTIQVDLATGIKGYEDSAVARFEYTIRAAETVAAPTAMPETKAGEPAVVKPGEKILLNCGTPGANIYYTLDGTSPVIHEDGTLSAATKPYRAEEAVIVPEGRGSLTVTAMAVKSGMENSAIVQFIYQYAVVLAPPYATPAEGRVSVNTQITLASQDKDARIYYTLDGSEPSVSGGRLYSEPILLTQDTIIKAISTLDGAVSAVRAFTFYVSPELTPPTPSVASGAVLSSGTVIELTAQQGAAIYYTTDGSNPKEGSPMTGSHVSITGEPGATVTLITYAKGSDYSDSQSATYIYMISNYENGIKASPESGTAIKAGDEIRLETDVTDAVIYYAVGGENPSADGQQGTSVIAGEGEEGEEFTLKATAVAMGAEFSGAVAAFSYPYMEMLKLPEASIPDGAVLLRDQEIVLTAESGDIYYTTDKTDPDETSDLYTGPISITGPATIKAIAISGEGAASEIASFSYTYAKQTESPSFSIDSGEVAAGTELTISSATPDAVIYYTMDGKEPDLGNPRNLYIYSGAITLNRAVNIKAVAVKDKMAESEMVSAIYTVREQEVSTVDEEEDLRADREEGDRLFSKSSYLNESAGPTYKDLVLKSAATGVVISAEADAIPVESGLDITEMPVDDALNRAVQSSAGRLYGAVASYDVAVVNGDESIHPQGMTELGLPIPQQYRNTAMSIARVDEEGNVVLYDTRRDYDMAYAFVEKFGQYCIVAPFNWQEEEESDWKMVGLAAGGVLLAAGYLFFRIGKKNRERTSILDE